MPRPTSVLYVCHGHPAVRPFGAEVYAHELYTAARADPRFDPAFLARVEPGEADHLPRLAPGAPLRASPDDPAEFWVETAADRFDSFYQALLDPELYARWLPPLLARLRPDVVHVHHTLYLGMDFLRAVRACLPAAAVVYTLHDFFPICAHRGLMCRTTDRGLCPGASPAACRGCFPDVSEVSFAARAKYVRDRLGEVDVFVAPSRQLAEKFVAWGLPAGRLVVEEYGRNPPAAPAPPAPGDARDRFAYFGQLNPFKGVDVLLEAARRLPPGTARVTVNGAGLGMQPPRFRDHLQHLFAAAGAAVADAGAYRPDELPGRMAGADWVVVPSVWWENSPLVIQEAFAHGRPVICSDAGGMAEKVRDGVDGLHFRVGDADALARVMARAAGEAGLWDRLRANVRPPHPMADHLAALAEVYRRAAAARPGEPART